MRTLSPGYFALVMATGIISVGLAQQRHAALSDALLGISVVAFAVLLALTGWRLAAHRTALIADVRDPAQGFGFFTFVAGANVLGARVAMDGWYATAATLLAVAGLAWLALGYVLPWSVVLGTPSRPVLKHADGSWFLWVVAAQSVAVSAASLEPALPGLRQALAATAVFSWSVGVFLYGAVGFALAARLLLYDLRPTEVTPPYWVAMGATAISVLAGARIVEMRPSPMVEATRGLVAGASVLFWAFGTWLIPVLVAAGWWRHRVHRVPLEYRPALWSLVFPLGMYSVAGTSLDHADHLPLTGEIGLVGLWVAFAVWALTLVAMLVHLVRTLVLPQPG